MLSMPCAPARPVLAPEPPSHTHAWPLRPRWAAIVRAALALGPVAVRIGDGACAMVQRGVLDWREGWHGGACAQAAGLSVDVGRLAYGVATQSRLEDGRVRRGFTFYDDQGDDILRIDLGAGASLDGFMAIAERYAPGRPDRLSDGREPGSPSAGEQRAMAEGIDGLAESDPVRLLQPGLRAAEQLAQLARHGLVEPMACDALLEVLRHASQADLAVRVSATCHGVRVQARAVLHHIGCQGGLVTACGVGTRLQWHEDLPGQRAWLLRDASARGLTQHLLLTAPGGELRLCLSSASPSSRPEPCAWRCAIDTARGGPSGLAC